MIVSLAMIVKNEGKYLKRCLDSVSAIVDEMIIVDTGSSDNTINIANQYPKVKLYEYKWCDNFSLARNFAIDQCTGDYILVLDADEYVTLGKREELESVIKKGIIGQLTINSSFEEHNQVYYSKAYVSRFFPKEVKYNGAIHEQLNSNLQRVIMKFEVKHDGYLNADKSIRNIPLLQKELEINPLDPYYLFQLGKEYRIKKQYNHAFHRLFESYKYVNKNVPYYGELIIELIRSGKESGEKEVINIIKDNEGALSKVSDFHFIKGLFYLDLCLNSPKEAMQYFSKIESSFLESLLLGNEVHTEYVQGTSSYLAAYNLGVFYEVTGNLIKAIKFYELASKYDYSLAYNRLITLKTK